MKKVAFILFLVLLLAGKSFSQEQKEEGLKYMDEEEENEIKANSKAESENKEQVKAEKAKEEENKQKQGEDNEEDKQEESDLKADKHSEEEPVAQFEDDKPEPVNYEKAAESEDMEQFDKQEELINDTYVYKDDDFENIPDHVDSLEMDSFLTEWEDSMGDYDPEYVYVFNLDKGETKEFYEDVRSDGIDVRGAFFVPGIESNSVDFQILNSKHELLFSKQSHNGIFKIKLEYKDLLKIIVKNSADTDIEFTISMNIGHNAIVKQNDLVGMDDKMNLLVTNINRMILEMKIKRNNYEDREKRGILTRNQENEPTRLHFLNLRDTGLNSAHSLPALLPEETV